MSKSAAGGRNGPPRVGAIVLLAALGGLSGCVDRPTTPPTTAGKPPRAPGSAPAWSEPASYSYVLESSCGEPALIGRFAIAVSAGRVTAVQGLDESARRAAQIRDAELVPTLGELVMEADTAREDGADEVHTEMDPTDGHPTVIRIDRDRNAVDDEACYAISTYTIGVRPSAGH